MLHQSGVAQAWITELSETTEADQSPGKIMKTTHNSKTKESIFSGFQNKIIPFMQMWVLVSEMSFRDISRGNFSNHFTSI